MYITLSETADELRANAASHGWDLSGIHMQELQPAENLRPEEQYTLFHPSEIELGDLSRSVFEAVETFKPARAVLDSVSDMRLLARDSLRYRRQILGLKQFFVGRGCTLLLLNENRQRAIPTRTFKASRTASFGSSSRFTTSASRAGGSRSPSCAAWSYVGGFHDFKIETGGIRVFPRLENRRQTRAARRRKRSRAASRQLDALLDDGVPMGTCTLILGPSGVGKSTLGAHYLASAAEKGIHCAAFLFDEQTADVPRPRRRARHAACRSTPRTAPLKIAKIEPGLDVAGRVQPSRAQGCRRRQRARGADRQPYRLSHGHSRIADAAVVRLHELASYLASCGVATFLTVAQQGMLGQNMMSPIDVSYIADTMFMMRFFEAGGRVRKALSVIKKRTGMHETTIREIGVKNNALWRR